jgi:hypothetical protein
VCPQETFTIVGFYNSEILKAMKAALFLLKLTYQSFYSLSLHLDNTWSKYVHKKALQILLSSKTEVLVDMKPINRKELLHSNRLFSVTTNGVVNCGVVRFLAHWANDHKLVIFFINLNNLKMFWVLFF